MVPDHDKQVVGSFVALLAPSLYSGFKRDKLIKFISLIYFSPQKKKKKKIKISIQKNRSLNIPARSLRAINFNIFFSEGNSKLETEVF